MKKILLLIVLAISAVSVSAQHTHAVGGDLNLSFGKGGVAFGVGAKYHHGFNDHWRATGDVKVLFAGYNALNVDANINYLFEVGSNDLKVYPLAGIGIYNWFGSGSATRATFNLGGGVDYPLTGNWYLNGEFKFRFYNAVREELSVGIMYKF